MIYILELREKLKIVYQKFGTYLNLLFKFIFGLAVFFTIKNAIGYDAVVSSTPVILALSLVTAFVPSGVFALICVIVAVVNVYKMSSILALFVVLVFLIMYFLVLRYTPKYGYVLVAMPVLLYYGVPYFMPIFLGIMSTPVTIVPVICGSIAFYTLKSIGSVTKGQDAVNPDEALAIFKSVTDKFKADKEMILVTVILAVVLLIVYVLKRSKFNHSAEIATITGVVVSMVIFLLACIGMDLEMGIVQIIVFSLLGGFVAYAAYFMRTVLDYSAVEIVQFEDDDYYYYVKAVPKIKIQAQVSKIKNISAAEEENSETEDVHAEEDETEYDEDESQEEPDTSEENEDFEIDIDIDAFSDGKYTLDKEEPEE